MQWETLWGGLGEAWGTVIKKSTAVPRRRSTRTSLETRTKPPRGQCLKTSIDFSFEKEIFFRFLCWYETSISFNTGCWMKIKTISFHRLLCFYSFSVKSYIKIWNIKCRVSIISIYIFIRRGKNIEEI